MDKSQIAYYVDQIVKHHAVEASAYLAEYQIWDRALTEILPNELEFLKNTEKDFNFSFFEKKEKLKSFNNICGNIKKQIINYEIKSDVAELKDFIELLNSNLLELIQNLRIMLLKDYITVESLLQKIYTYNQGDEKVKPLFNQANANIRSNDSASLNVVDYVNRENVSASSNGSNVRFRLNSSSNLLVSSNGRVNYEVDKLNSLNPNQKIWVRADKLNLGKNMSKPDYYLLSPNEISTYLNNLNKVSNKELQCILLNLLKNAISVEAKTGITSIDYVLLSNLLNKLVFYVNSNGLHHLTVSELHGSYCTNSKINNVIGGLNTAKNLKKADNLIVVDFDNNLFDKTPKYIEYIINNKIINTFNWFSNYYGIDVNIYDFLDLKGQGTINEDSSMLINNLSSNNSINLNNSRFLDSENSINFNMDKNPYYMNSWYIKSPLFYGLFPHENDI